MCKCCCSKIWQRRKAIAVAGLNRIRVDRSLLRVAARDRADPISEVSGTPSMVAGTWRPLREAGVPAVAVAVEALHGDA